MSIECGIEFDNLPSKLIHAGQMIRGTVYLALSDVKEFKSIFIEFIGHGSVRFKEGRGQHYIKFKGKEAYLNERTYFVGNVIMSPGAYTYTFECMLPHHLPPSFDGKYGHIRYKARVVLEFSMRPDSTFDVPFTVFKGLNLNADAYLREPVVAKKYKTFYKFCLPWCKTDDSLIMVGRIPVRGYIPGQTIELFLNVYNRTEQRVSEFKVQLMKHIDYFSETFNSRIAGRKVQTVVLHEEKTRGCDIDQNEDICVNIIVPVIPPTDIRSSDLIKIHYYIQVIGSVGSCHKNPWIKIPIVIGTHPILGDKIPDAMHPYIDYPMGTSTVKPLSNIISTQPQPSQSQPQSQLRPHQQLQAYNSRGSDESEWS